MAKLLNLLEWASETYSKPPSLSTLRRWVRQGRIYPCPELHGREYMLEPGSIYVDPRKSKMVRKTSINKPPKKGSLLEKLKHVEKAGTIRR
ncbi:excisionase [Pantoea sp. Mb-10]|uniref:excisionase n=1 Tax=unclassified Pantoea TaxID=2630326 RepID=UPI001E438E4F|nr:MULTISPECIES: excisionase [unclassified Pantoea]MCE0491406.1 excisionase [Pantoea sp. Mb-10]MCE0502220.1 excisionase [Pantoea sp. Pb-8]